ncbi:unnamed protein product [Leptosia nina]|uniref:Uncharacterized protein n=1 Tax=Leptosia nina TaxID=320188 RepID=A0AAV1JVN8_9NEOP
MSKIYWKCVEEGQLLAEEKWIIQALNLIKKERNCLQIEKLQLESLKMQQSQRQEKLKIKTDIIPSTSIIELMKSNKKSNSGDLIMYEEMDAITSACNDEELHLAATTPVFGDMSEAENIETEEEEEEMDVMIDINMLMDSECDKS